MAYTKQTWENGQTIYASGMNHIEDGIADADTAASGSVRFNASQEITTEQQAQARANIDAVKASIVGTTLVFE